MTTKGTTGARQNFSINCEQLLHKQITMELVAAYIYQSMSAYFSQDNVALRGLSKFFRESYKEVSVFMHFLAHIWRG